MLFKLDRYQDAYIGFIVLRPNRVTAIGRTIFDPEKLVSVPLESRTADVPLEDPWLIAERLFAPCYIGGWSAAEYLDLTECRLRLTAGNTKLDSKAKQ